MAYRTVARSFVSGSEADPSEVMEVEHVHGQFLGNEVYTPADLTPDVLGSARNLVALSERGDWLIAATAVALDVTLMTRDGEIAACPQVERPWD